MNINITACLLASIAIATSSAVASPAEAQKLFAFANQGKFIEILNQAKSQLISTEDLYVERDANGNTIISALLKNFPLAVANFGKANATEYINTLMDRFLSALPKEQAASDLLNVTNTDGRTALQYAIENDLLRTATVLHGKGALTIVDGKKASDYVKGPKLAVVVKGWEQKDIDNTQKGVSEAFGEFGQAVRKTFAPDAGDSLASKLEYYKKARAGEATEPQQPQQK